MENKQNSSNNKGIGTFGNNINNQSKNINKSIPDIKSEILKDLHKSIDKLDDFYKFNIYKTKKDNFSYAKIFLITLFSAILFWFLAVISYKFFGFEINSTNIVLTLVGIIATFIVISNYLQIYEMKSDLNNYYENVDTNIKKIMVESIEEYKHNIFTAIFHLQGVICYTEKDFPDALEFYMRALNELNNTSDKEQLERLMVDIIVLLEKTNLSISTKERNEYLNLVIRSGSESSSDVIRYINNLEIDDSLEMMLNNK